MLNKETLDRGVRDADAVIQRERGRIFFLRAWPWLFVGLGTCFLVDVALQLDATTRLLLAMGFLATAIGVAAITLVIIKIRKNPPQRTARILEMRDPRLGSRLINLIQLAGQREDLPAGSLTQRMADQAVDGYLDTLNPADLEQAARTDSVRFQARRSGFLLVGFSIVFLLLGPISLLEVLRFVDPFGDHPPFTLTRLDILSPGPDGTNVLYGGELTVKSRYRGHRPGTLFLTFHPPEQPEAGSTVPLYARKDQLYSQTIDSIRTPLEVYVHTRNRRSISQRRRVDLILTPQLEGAKVTVTPPAYTGEPAQTQPLRFKTLRALEGSTLAFALTSNRPLDGGYLEQVRVDREPERVPMATAGPHSVTQSVVASSSARLQFSLLDEDGTLSDGEWETGLTVTHDRRPSIRIMHPGATSIASMDHVLDIRIQAGDDYGLSRIRLHRGHNGAYGEPQVWTIDRPATKRSATVEHEIVLSETWAESGDELTFFAEAIDNAPSPNVSRSDIVRVLVVTEDEYNDLLRQERDMRDMAAKYAALIDHLQEQIRRQQELQEDLLAMHQALSKPGSTDPAPTESEYRELLSRQQEVNQALDQVADRMDHFVRDNPLYDVESQWGEELQQFAQRVRDSTEANRKDLDALEKSGGDSPSFSVAGVEGAGDAAQEQLERLGAVSSEADAQIMAPLEDLALLHELIKDLNQFKLLYQAQDTLTGQLAAYRDQPVLSREDQLIMKQLAGEERIVSAKLQRLEEKLLQHAADAEETFPLAAQSGRDLAEAMSSLRLAPRAAQTTEKILAGKGPASYEMAAAIRDDMASLFGQCSSCRGNMAGSLDQYLRLTMGSPPGNTFEQMSMCLKYGWGSKPGMGLGMGMGGIGGESGYSIQSGPTTELLGGESSITADSRSPLSGRGPNQEPVDPASALQLDFDDPDVVETPDRVHRESRAVAGEITIETYKELVDQYFERLTAPPAEDP